MTDHQKLLDEIHAATDVHIDMHFVYTGNAHGDGYVNYRALGEPENFGLLGETSVALLLKTIETAGLDPNEPIIVVGPETLGALMVKYLTVYSAVPVTLNGFIFNKAEGEKQFVWDQDPGSAINPEAQIVWMDDLLNAGSTLKATKKMVETAGGKISAIAVIGDRSGLSPSDIDVPHTVALETISLTRYDLDDGPCELCDIEKPIIRRPGHGYRFEEENPDYRGGFTDL